MRNSSLYHMRYRTDRERPMFKRGIISINNKKIQYYEVTGHLVLGREGIRHSKTFVNVSGLLYGQYIQTFD